MTPRDLGLEVLRARKAFQKKPSYRSALDIQVSEKQWAKACLDEGAVPLVRLRQCRPK